MSAVAAMVVHVALRWGDPDPAWMADVPLIAVLLGGGGPLVHDLLRRAAAGQFGSDLLAAISIVTASIVGEYLAGTIVVLMLAGGAVLEQLAVGRASSVLEALARRLGTRWCSFRMRSVRSTAL
jgi:cation transport ATPase